MKKINLHNNKIILQTFQQHSKPLLQIGRNIQSYTQLSRLILRILVCWIKRQRIHVTLIGIWNTEIDQKIFPKLSII